MAKRNTDPAGAFGQASPNSSLASTAGVAQTALIVAIAGLVAGMDSFPMPISLNWPPEAQEAGRLRRLPRQQPRGFWLSMGFPVAWRGHGQP
jgi:hypothetical protein